MVVGNVVLASYARTGRKTGTKSFSQHGNCSGVEGGGRRGAERSITTGPTLSCTYTRDDYSAAAAGIVAGDRSKLRKVSFEQISEWCQSKASPPLPAVLPQQRQSKEEMESILGSLMDEVNMAHALVGLGMRGVYGGALDILAVQTAVDLEGASAAVRADTVKEIEIQAQIYNACDQSEGERSMLDRLLVLYEMEIAAGGSDEDAAATWRGKIDSAQSKLQQLDRRQYSCRRD